MRDSAESQRAEAVRLIGESDFGAAASVLYGVLGSTPRDVELLAGLGRACLRVGRVEEAARIFRVCVERRRDPVFLDGLGAALAALGRTEEAELCLSEAVARDPLLADAWAGLARIGRLRPSDPLREALLAHLDDRQLPEGPRRLLAGVLTVVDRADGSR